MKYKAFPAVRQPGGGEGRGGSPLCAGPEAGIRRSVAAPT